MRIRSGLSRASVSSAFSSAPRRSVALLVFLLAMTLVHPSSALCAPGVEEGIGQDRVSTALTAPMDRDVAPEKRLEDGPPANAPPPDSRADDPLSQGVFFLKRHLFRLSGTLEGQHAFNRLIARILSPSSRRSWG